MITINQLKKAYNQSKPVIDRLDLQVETGASVSIRGASGSGKSTLLSLIAGFTAPRCRTHSDWPLLAAICQ